MTKPKAICVCVGFAMIVLSPINEHCRGERGDSFPLSWYPMFSRPRPRLERVDYMVGMDRRGGRHVIHSRHYVRGGMNQARRQTTRLASDKRSAERLCLKLADKMTSMNGFDEIVQIRLVRGRFSMSEYFRSGNKIPVSEEIWWSCDVPGRNYLPRPNRGRTFVYRDSWEPQY